MEDPPTVKSESYLLEDGRRVAPEPAGGRRARVGLEAAVRVADGRASHDALAELDDVLALELGKQPLEGQSRDNRETIERQSRDNRVTIERQSRDNRETIKRQSRYNRETIKR